MPLSLLVLLVPREPRHNTPSNFLDRRVLHTEIRGRTWHLLIKNFSGIKTPPVFKYLNPESDSLSRGELTPVHDTFHADFGPITLRLLDVKNPLNLLGLALHPKSHSSCRHCNVVETGLAQLPFRQRITKCHGHHYAYSPARLPNS